MTSASEDRWRDLRPDPENDTPLYLQLARKLGAAIHENRWNAGEALPSERVLSEALGVSRITSRKAIALLVEQGLIRRTQGAGSLITPRYEDPLSRLSSFSEMLRRRGFTPSSKWLSREILPASAARLSRTAAGGSIPERRKPSCTSPAIRCRPTT